MTGPAARPLAIRALLRFPTTTAVLAPYLLVILPLALWNDTPGTDFILMTAALAAGGAFAVEGALATIALTERSRGPQGGTAPRRGSVRSAAPSLRWDGERVAVVARVVAVVSIVANVGAPALGASTLQTQVAGDVAGGFAGALTPFNAWGQVALALCITAHFLTGMTRPETLTWVGALLAAQVAAAWISNITVQLGSLTVLVVALFLMTRLVRPTVTLTGVAVVAAAWPTVFAIRNALRLQNGIDVDESATAAADRLRFDEQVVRAREFGAGHDLGQPDFWQALRYGLVPRILDPSRPPISSGSAVNEFLGGTSTSAYTFLPVATVWFFWGALAVVLVYASAAMAVCALRPWRSVEVRPVAMVLFVLLIGGPLSMLATPPDSFIKLLQTLVATAPVLLVLQVWARVRVELPVEEPHPHPHPHPHPSLEPAR